MNATAAAAAPVPAFDVWAKRVAGSVRVKRPEDVEKIALICLAADAAGMNACTWHSSAVFYGNLDRCQCGPCVTARAA